VGEKDFRGTTRFRERLQERKRLLFKKPNVDPNFINPSKKGRKGGGEPPLFPSQELGVRK
jgi:hypothetical protein